MANRQARRDLQIRLAERLQIARTEGVAPSWLAVQASGNYLFAMAQAGEIFPSVQTHSVPYTKSWFLGVANLRGGLLGVVDLAGFIASFAAAADPSFDRRGSPAAARPNPPAPSKEAMLIAMNALFEVNCALLVERLAGIRNQQDFSHFSPKPPASPDYFGNCYTDHSGLVWQEINLQLLVQQPSFLTLGA